MLSFLYQCCVLIFVAQGLALPVLILLCFRLGSRQDKQLAILKGELALSPETTRKRNDASERMFGQLPQFQPLKCPSCGAGLLLQATQTLCPNCQRQGPVPKDYQAALSLKAHLSSVLRSALWHWRVARVLTSSWMKWIFRILIFAEPLLLFPTVLIGSNVFQDTWLDHVLKSLGDRATLVIFIPAFLGFVIWMIVFIMLANLSKSLRSGLPVFPVFTRELHTSEVGQCQSCGGGVQFDRGAFAVICDYCHVVNYRVQFVRQERLRDATEETQAKFTLFGALHIIAEFVGMFWILSLILVVGAAVLVLCTVVKNCSG